MGLPNTENSNIIVDNRAKQRVIGIAMKNDEGLMIIDIAYQLAYKLHLIMLVYHELYGMKVDVKSFQEFLNSRSDVLMQHHEMNVDELIDSNLAEQQIILLNNEANSCYQQALNISRQVHELEETIIAFEKERNLQCFKTNQEFVYDHMVDIQNEEHIKFITDNQNLLN